MNDDDKNTIDKMEDGRESLETGYRDEDTFEDSLQARYSYERSSMDEDSKGLEDENEKEPVKKNRLTAYVMELLFYGIMILLCIFVIPQYVIQRTIVDGTSMEETLHDKENLLVEKLSYRFGDPQRFDVIVFYPYGKDMKEYYVKRIIGLPGETVQIRGADIYINDVILEEDFGKMPITNAGIAEEGIELGKEEYFVMGDNREVSLDSRYDEVGPIRRELIAGKAVFRIWPLKKFGLFE